MRKLEAVVLSDLHLGTYGCHAKELGTYLNSIEPDILILNGDIIDMWQFKKSYFPVDHWEVIMIIMDKIKSGVEVYYITGNHDDVLRRFSDDVFGNFHLVDKLVLQLDGKKHWIFHGDVFDNSVNISRWLAQFGGKAYDLLIRINRLINNLRFKIKRPPISFSKKIKRNVKKAVKFISDFEEVAIELGLENQYDYVICGHIHQPNIRDINSEKGRITYMNSGDWVESLTALEYNDGAWLIYDHLATSMDREMTTLRLEPEFA